MIVRKVVLLVGASLAACRHDLDVDGPPEQVDTAVATPFGTPAGRPDGDGTCVRHVPPPALPALPPAAHHFPSEALFDEQIDCAIVEDLDADGRVDLLTLRVAEDGTRLDAWYGAAVPRQFDHVHAELRGVRGPKQACLPRDVDGDGDLDVLFAVRGGLVAALAEGRSFDAGRAILDLGSDDPTTGVRTSFLAALDLDGRPPLDLVVGTEGQLAGSACDIDAAQDAGTHADFASGAVRCFTDDGGGLERAPASVCADPLLPSPMLIPYAGLVADLDDDGDGDLVVANDFGENRILLREPSGLVLADATGFEFRAHTMGLAIGDVDGDGLRDLYGSDVNGDQLYLSAGCLRWFEGGRATGAYAATRNDVNWGAFLIDVDANGALDVVVQPSVEATEGLSGSTCDVSDGRYPVPPVILLLNDGTGRLTRHDLPMIPADAGHGEWKDTLLVHGDLDGDGDDDFVVSASGTTRIAWNDAPRAGGLLRVRPVDAQGLPVEGARVTVETATGSRVFDLWPSYLGNGASETAALMTFGDDAGEATVRVRWPDGSESTHGPFPPGRTVTVAPPS